MAVLFALLSSLCIGINTILVKKSLSKASPFTVAAVLTFVGTVFFWLLAIVSLPPDSYRMNFNAILFFFIAGIFAPGLVRWIFFVSIDRVGPSISSSILATIPVFAAMIAIIFLNESLSWVMAVGIFMIIGGIIIFEKDIKGNGPERNYRRTDLALPILAAIVASIAINLRKLGLQELNLPVLAAAVGFGSTSAVYLTGLLISFNLRKQFTISIQDIPIFIAGGFSLALGWLCILYALSHGQVVLVAPLLSLHPLVVLALSALFLKDIEKITSQTVIGCCSVLLGVILITAV